MALRLIDVLRTLCFICASIPAVVSQTPPFYDTGYNYIRDYIYDPRTEYISSYSDYSAQGCTSISNILQRASSESGALAEFRAAVALAADALAETEAGDAFLDAINESELRPLAEQVTIFVPTNDAVTEAAAAFREDLATPVDRLVDVLPNHMVFSDLTEGALDDFFELYGPSLATDTAVESTILINLIDEAIFIQSEGIAAPGGEVLVLGLRTCAGPIHVIDRVLLPTMLDGSVVDLESSETALAPVADLFPGLVFTPGPPEGCSSIAAVLVREGLTTFIDILAEDPDNVLGTDVGAVILSALNETRQRSRDELVTLFVPTNAAFAVAGNDFYSSSSYDYFYRYMIYGAEEPFGRPANALPNHVFFSDYTEGALLDLFDYYGPYLEIESLSENRLRFSLLDEGIFLQSEGIDEPGAEIVQANLFGCGGVVHIIDRVLLPVRLDGSAFDLGPSTSLLAARAESPLAAATQLDY